MYLVPPQIMRLLPISAHPTLLRGDGASPNGLISVHTHDTVEYTHSQRE